jgi:hypothetical protein
MVWSKKKKPDAKIKCITTEIINSDLGKYCTFRVDYVLYWIT